MRWPRADRTFDRDEVEDAFRNYYRVGAVGERWEEWGPLFTADALYVEHVFGTMRGTDEISEWIVAVMAHYPAVYTVYEFHAIAGNTISLYVQNRRDHPDPSQPPIDFPSFTVLEYAGDGRFFYEEDFYSVHEATRATKAYAEAIRDDPDFPLQMTRRSWGEGPDWTKGEAEAPESAKAAARAAAEGVLPAPKIRPFERP